MLKNVILLNPSNQTKLLELTQISVYFGVENVVLVKPTGSASQYAAALLFKEFGDKIKLAILPEVEDVFSFLKISAEETAFAIPEKETAFGENFSSLIIPMSYPVDASIPEKLSLKVVNFCEKLPETANLTLLLANKMR